MFAIQDSRNFTTQIYPIPSMGILRQKRQAAGSSSPKEHSEVAGRHDVELRDEEPRFGIWNALLPQTALDWHSVMLQSKVFQRYMRLWPRYCKVHGTAWVKSHPHCPCSNTWDPIPQQIPLAGQADRNFREGARNRLSWALPLEPPWGDGVLHWCDGQSPRRLWRAWFAHDPAAHSQWIPQRSPLMSKAYIWLISTVNVRKHTLHG